MINLKKILIALVAIALIGATSALAGVSVSSMRGAIKPNLETDNTQATYTKTKTRKAKPSNTKQIQFTITGYINGLLPGDTLLFHSIDVKDEFSIPDEASFIIAIKEHNAFVYKGKHSHSQCYSIEYISESLQLGIWKEDDTGVSTIQYNKMPMYIEMEDPIFLITEGNYIIGGSAINNTHLGPQLYKISGKYYNDPFYQKYDDFKNAITRVDAADKDSIAKLSQFWREFVEHSATNELLIAFFLYNMENIDPLDLQLIDKKMNKNTRNSYYGKLFHKEVQLLKKERNTTENEYIHIALNAAIEKQEHSESFEFTELLKLKLENELLDTDEKDYLYLHNGGNILKTFWWDYYRRYEALEEDTITFIRDSQTELQIANWLETTLYHKTQKKELVIIDEDIDTTFFEYYKDEVTALLNNSLKILKEVINNKGAEQYFEFIEYVVSEELKRLDAIYYKAVEQILDVELADYHEDYKSMKIIITNNKKAADENIIEYLSSFKKEIQLKIDKYYVEKPIYRTIR
ncbi:MAG: hypothetical protein LBO69_05265 [Ignavibacteria bacterium]|jgi:hypothetical protein|nr:hypothetical protein [Ignavibacteria bacterium]